MSKFIYVITKRYQGEIEFTVAFEDENEAKEFLENTPKDYYGYYVMDEVSFVSNNTKVADIFEGE